MAGGNALHVMVHRETGGSLWLAARLSSTCDGAQGDRRVPMAGGKAQLYKWWCTGRQEGPHGWRQGSALQVVVHRETGGSPWLAARLSSTSGGAQGDRRVPMAGGKAQLYM